MFQPAHRGGFFYVPMKLTIKQQRFINAYMGEAKGNATQAARLAGYKGNGDTLKQVGAENLAKPYIKAEIERLTRNDPLIATREEIQQFWTEVAKGHHGATLSDQLKASELLAKSRAMFNHKQEIDMNLKSITDVILEADKITASGESAAHVESETKPLCH